jgi:exo-beta-1,3-glucanase (GH17 family)
LKKLTVDFSPVPLLVNHTNPYKYFVVQNGDIFQSGQALIAANSYPYWQDQQQRQAEKEPVFIEVICEDWYYKPTLANDLAVN